VNNYAFNTRQYVTFDPLQAVSKYTCEVPSDNEYISIQELPLFQQVQYIFTTCQLIQNFKRWYSSTSTIKSAYKWLNVRFQKKTWKPFMFKQKASEVWQQMCRH